MLDHHDQSPRSQAVRPPARRRVLTTAVAITALSGLAIGAATTAASADQDSSTAGAPKTSMSTTRHDGVQQALDRLVRDDKFPAALAAVRDRDGRTRNYTAGVGDLGTGAKVPVDGQVRIGSNTKTFTSTVVLQLVGEGKVDLNAPIEKYLPGLVRGDGIDGRKITVHQLLQHTSGLPDYLNVILAGGFAKVQHTYFEPRDLVDAAMKQKASFAPGTKFEYSNTNYALAGLLVEKVTGRPLAEQITDRIIKPLGLRHTYFPGIGEQTVRGRHPHGYDAETPGQKLRDVTVLDPSWGWAAGELVSTNTDLNRFFSALLAGKLLKPAQLKQMRTTVPATGLWTGARYGLGLFSTPLTCGGLVWGHGGDIQGTETRGGVTEDGRAVNLTVTALPSAVAAAQGDEKLTDKASADTIAFVDTALCK